MLILPAGLKLLGNAATALAESCIAKVTVKDKSLAVSLLDCSLCRSTDNACAALVTLAVVIGTYIKQCVLVMVIPLDYAVQDMIMTGIRGCRCACHMIRRAQLCQNPTA